MWVRLLARVARLALRRPRAVLLATVLPSGLMTALAFTVPLDFSFGGLMDRTHPEVARYFEASARYGLGGWVPILLEGPEPRLDDAATALEDALANHDGVRSVQDAPPLAWLRERAPWWVERELFDAWLALVRDPEDADAGALVASGLGELDERFGPRRSDGARLVLATLSDDPFEVALDAEGFPRLRRAVRDAVAPFGVEASFAGMAAIVTEEQEATIERMRWLAPLSLLLVLLVLRVVVERVAWLAAMAGPIVLAAGLTLGLVGGLSGRLTIMEAVFGVLLFGLGIDFGIHWWLRLREERAGGRSLEESVERAVAGTGRGIVAGALTTGGAFLLLALAPEPVFLRLGVSGGIGLLASLVLLLTMLPAVQSQLAQRDGSPRSLRIPGLTALSAFAVRRPIGCLVGTAVLLATCAVTLPRFRYETDLERVFSQEIRAVDTARRIHEAFGLDPRPWVVASEDLSEARRVVARFEADPLFGRVDSLAFLFPEDREERARRLAGLPPALDAAPEPLGTLGRAARLGPPRLDELPPALSERLLGPDGELLVYAFAANPRLDAETAGVERRAAQAIAPGATSMVAVFEALIGTDRPWMPSLTACVLVFVAVVVWLDLRGVRLAIVALTPALVGSIASFGLLTASGFAFNTVTLVGIPLLLGLGVDDGIHVAHRLKEQPHRRVEHVMGSVAPAVAMTTATTCASVVTLLFTRHPGIVSLATLLLVGLPLCLLATAWVLPALAVCLGLQPNTGGQPGVRDVGPGRPGLGTGVGKADAS